MCLNPPLLIYNICKNKKKFSASRIPSGAMVCDHITSIFFIGFLSGIDYNILMLTYKTLHELARQYLAKLLTSCTPSRNFRFSHCGFLVFPKTQLCCSSMIKQCTVWFKDISDPAIFVAVDIEYELLMPYLIGVQKII